MKVIISKKEIQANNDVLAAIVSNLDMFPSEKKRVLKDAIARLDDDFKGVVDDLQKKVVESGDARKVSFSHYHDGDDFIVMVLYQDYYLGHMELLKKYAKPMASIINGLYGLVVAFKAAAENFGFILKGYEAEAKKLEEEFSSKKED